MRRLLRAIFRHWDLKLAAALLAAITWYYGITAGVEERRFTGVAVKAINPTEDVALLYQDARSAAIVLRGPRRELDALKAPELLAVLDIGELTQGNGEAQVLRVPLATRHLRVGREAETAEALPAGVALVRAEPEAVSLTLDRVSQVEMPVDIVVEGEPAPGLVLKRAAQPPSVTVRGAARLLQRLRTIRTEPIRVDGLRERLQRRVALQRQVASGGDPGVLLQAKPDHVDVTLDVAATPEEKAFERVPVRLAAVPANVAVIKQDVREVAIRLSGPRQAIREIDAPTLVAELSLDGTRPPAGEPTATTVPLRRESFRQALTAASSAPLARDIELLDVKPRVVTLTLDRAGERTLPVKPVPVGAPAQDFELGEIAAIPDKVAVRGPEAVLKELKFVETLPVSVAGLKERLRSKVALVETVSTAAFGKVRIEPLQHDVDVAIAVGERREAKALTALPVLVLVRPEVAVNIRIEVSPRTVGPVSFVGPRSHMEDFRAEDVTAFVILDITGPADLRPTDRYVQFYISDPLVRLAPEAKPIQVKVEFPPPERGPEPPKKKE